MSDEAHIEAAWRHADQSARRPWQALAPDAAMMEREEGMTVEERRGTVQQLLLVYLFADGKPEVWQHVALRALAILKFFAVGILLQRGWRLADELELTKALPHRVEFSFGDFVEMAEADADGILLRMLDYFFPPGRDWLKRGCERVYLIARNYQPWLVTLGDAEMNYEEMARIFEGDALATRKSRDRARSRWSARAQKVIRKPIEKAGGTIHMQFGKSASTRAKYAERARGNGNRKGSSAE